MTTFLVISGHVGSVHTTGAESLEDAAWEARQCAARRAPAAVVIRLGEEQRPARPVFAIWADGRDYRESRSSKIGAQVLSYIQGKGRLPS